jgi:hypothetical protein
VPAQASLANVFGVVIVAGAINLIAGLVRRRAIIQSS